MSSSPGGTKPGDRAPGLGVEQYPHGEGLRGFNGSKARSRRLSRQPFVNPADGMLRPPVLPRTQQPPGRGCSWRLAAARLPHDEAGRPMTRRNPRIVAEYLHKAGWRERTIGAGTTNGGDYGRPHRGRDSRDCHAEAEAGGGRGAHPRGTRRLPKPPARASPAMIGTSWNFRSGTQRRRRTSCPCGNHGAVPMRIMRPGTQQRRVIG
jgi:hypothetical protein